MFVVHSAAAVVYFESCQKVIRHTSPKKCCKNNGVKKPEKFHQKTYVKVVSTGLSHVEAYADFFRLAMKEKFDIHLM